MSAGSVMSDTHPTTTIFWSACTRTLNARSLLIGLPVLNTVFTLPVLLKLRSRAPSAASSGPVRVEQISRTEEIRVMKASQEGGADCPMIFLYGSGREGTLRRHQAPPALQTEPPESRDILFVNLRRIR